MPLGLRRGQVSSRKGWPCSPGLCPCVLALALQAMQTMEEEEPLVIRMQIGRGPHSPCLEAPPDFLTPWFSVTSNRPNPQLGGSCRFSSWGGRRAPTCSRARNV